MKKLRPNLSLRSYSTLGLIGLLLAACSIEQNNVTSNVYHNLTAHYNGFYYAREKSREVEKLILKSLDDDHNLILRLFPKLDTVLAKSYSKDTEEIVKMASLSIQRHPNSRWVDDGYIQVGLARLYACDFQNAIQTFKYVNTKSTDMPLRHQALIYLMRTFIELNDFDRAEEVFRFLEKESLNKVNKKNLLMEKAYFYQLKGDYDNMVRNLSEADPLLMRKDRKGRIYFIIGQVYQELGFNSEAYNYYRKCISTNPEYEVDFYARLNMAQVAELTSKKDVQLVRKQFEKMLKDAKNAEFADKIYFELGQFEQKQGNLAVAIEDYSKSAHAGKNKRIQGSAYLNIGQIQFDSLKKYSLAKLYYDSAVSALPKDFENYEAIKKRQEVLGEFAQYTETISLNDSLLYLSSFDSLTLRHRLDSVFSASAKKLETSKKKKKKVNESNGGNRNQNNAFFNSSESSATVDWYFGNTSAVSLGQTEFQRIWGTVALEDNWRRSNKSASLTLAENAPEEVVTKKDDEKESDQKSKPDEVGALMAKLPKTDKQKKELLDKIEEAYFKLGDLYYFSLIEKENAAATYEKLLERFPDSELKPEALYKLYLIYKEKDEAKSNSYAQILKDQYPTSTFTRVLLNPDYLKEASVAAEKQKLIYKSAYAFYKANNLRAAQEKLSLAFQVGETGFNPQLELLKTLLIGRTEDATRYQFELGEFIKKYPDDPLKEYAEQLLASSRTALDKMEKAKGIRFSTFFDQPHLFVVAYDEVDKITNPVSTALEKFNESHWKELKMTTSNLALNNEKILTIITELPDKATALSYFDQFLAQLSNVKPFSNYKFHNFVITKDNFQTFYRTKALDEYLLFFDRNYQK